MSHLSSIGASIFTDLAVCVDDVATTGANAIAIATFNETNAVSCFAAAADYERITDVREFPSVGTPANIVNVPVYGQKTSAQVQGQADAPSLEVTVNYIAADWASGTTLGDMVGDGIQRVFRVTLLNTTPTGYDMTAGSLGTVENSTYYFIGKIEALLVNPQLTDATTATITLSTQSDFIGAFTI